MPAHALRDKYRAHRGTLADADDLDRRALEDEWRDQYDAALRADRAGREIELGLVSGAVLPFWRALEKTVAEKRDDMTRAGQALKVVRVVLDDGAKLVGIRFPKAVLPFLKSQLRDARAKRRPRRRRAAPRVRRRRDRRPARSGAGRRRLRDAAGARALRGARHVPPRRVVRRAVFQQDRQRQPSARLPQVRSVAPLDAQEGPLEREGVVLRAQADPAP